MRNMEHRILYIVLLLVSKACVSSTQTTTQDTKDVTSNPSDTRDKTTLIENGNVTNNATYTSKTVVKHCALLPKNGSISEEIQTALDNGKTMLRFKLKFRGEDWLPVNVSGKATSDLFKPFYWVRTRGRFGTRLLLLKPNYGIMSFRSLEIKVEKFPNINLEEYPKHCMDNLSYDDIEILIRELVMNKFKNESDILDDTDNVCNLHITNDDGVHFRYYCCQQDEDMSITCDYLETDIWLTLIQYVILVSNVFVVLFCPLLIPKRFFRKLSDSDYFRYNLDKAYKIMFQLKEVDSYRSKQKQYTKSDTIYVRLSEINDMEKLKTEVQKMPLGETKTFDVNVAELQTDGKRLVNPGQAPSQILKTLYEFVLNCRMREMPSVNLCCDANICECTPYRFTWHSCASVIMKIFLGLLIITPWVIRVFIYYHFEHNEMTMRMEAARDKGYVLPFPDKLTWYLTTYYWIVICMFVLLCIEALICGVINNNIKEEFKFIFRKCNQDMLADSRTKAFGQCMHVLLLPFTKYGCFVGVFMFTALIPVAVVYMLYHLFPLINLSGRMIVDVFIYVCRPHDIIENKDRKKHRISDRHLCGRLIQFCVILMCLTTIYSYIVLLFEITTFFLDFFIHTMIGCILFADYLMTYISLFVLLVVYERDCLGSVPEQYRQYSSTLNNYLMTLCEKQATPFFYENSKKKKNRAFAVVPCSAKDDPCEAAGRVWPDHNDVNVTYDSGHLTWNVKKVAFFLTENDGPMIPLKFLFDSTRYMLYSNKPGRLLHLYLKGLLNFILIVAFLIFVFLVVMAFGETGTISISNQLLATVAGGIVPFILRKFVFAENKQPKIDPENDINFRVAVHDFINKYEQSWPIYDLDIIKPIEPEVPMQPEGDSGTVISEPPTTINEQSHHTVEETNREKITKVIIEFKTSDIDKDDFPKLFKKMREAQHNREERIY